MKDRYHDFYDQNALYPTSGIVDASITGQDVDLQGYGSVRFVVHVGKLSSITSASYWVIRMMHTDASALGAGPSDYANVAGSNVIGSGFSLGTALTSGIVLSIWSDHFSQTMFACGYRGNKRYVRLMLEEKGNLSTADISATAQLGDPAQWPASDGVSVTL